MDDRVPAEGESRRERLKRHRAERILEAAAAVFARKGFHPATIREIAERADVAEGTIYNYFADKQDLLVSMAHYLIASSTGRALAEFEGDDDRGFMIGLLADRFQFAGENYDFIRALMAHVWQDQDFRRQYLGEVVQPLIGALEQHLKRRIEAGSVRPLNTPIIIRAMLGSFLVFLLLAEPGDARLDLGVSRQQLAAELADFFLFGLQARPEPRGDQQP